MTKIKCLIVDDEAPARRVIAGFIALIEDAELIGSVKNAWEAKTEIDVNNVDVVFLDIDMPEISGIELLKMIKMPPVVILTTAYAEYGAESYEYEVTDYLLKPIRFERFVKAFCKAKDVISKQALTDEGVFTKDYFEFKIDREIKKILLKEILYILSLGNYVKIVTTDKTYLSLITTKEIEEHLKGSNFLRLHKSIIVNTKAIEHFDNVSVTINKINLPIGKTFRKYVLDKLQDSNS